MQLHPAAAILGVTSAALLVAAGTLAVAADPSRPVTAAQVRIRHSQFAPDELIVPAGVPVTITIVNDDPIDHEWIVGDEALHARHRSGSEPVHDTRPTEVTLPALSTRTTTVRFAAPGEYRFVCHLPGHEGYGMTGIVRVVAG
ncbi:MAG TPA: cupredoxin domain-containing protein [Candidatus Limnocylindrales bacterium]|nr:cupredoxin domain-containing protein [Candidatus Limnocylindrales bacterium]